MQLNDVHRGIHKNKRRRRIGRGPGSGFGKTSGRGHNGQGSRAGNSQSPAFEGGKMPLVRRVPKRGFNNRWAKRIAVVNVGDLEMLFAAGDEVSPESIHAKGLARRQYDYLKVLGNGELTKQLTVSAHRFSQSAADKIRQAGGEAVTLPTATAVAEKQRAAKAERAASK